MLSKIKFLLSVAKNINFYINAVTFYDEVMVTAHNKQSENNQLSDIEVKVHINWREAKSYGETK